MFASALRDNLIANLSKKFLEIIHLPNAESAVILAICGILDSKILADLPKIVVDFEIKEQIKDENGETKEVAKMQKREYYEIFAKCWSYKKCLNLPCLC